jgi:predicted nucleic acid-binding protein
LISDSLDYLIDTNILLRLTRPQDPNYTLVRSALRNLSARGARLYFALQNIAEFWNVCTRPTDRNGFGLSPEETCALVESIERTMSLLPENETVYAAWRSLVRDLRISGVQVHDARLAALMQVHGLTQILTLNSADFVRFQAVSAIHPSKVA